MGILPNCKDPSLKKLKSAGYNVVRLPRVDLLPTQLLVSKDNSLQRFGELRTVFVADPALAPPPVGPDRPGPTIGGTLSADIDIGIGLNILGGLISALGGSTIGLEVAYSRARSIQFEFTDTLVNDAEVALLDQYLAGSTIHPLARSARQLLDAERVYVVTSTLKSKSIKVVAKDASKQVVTVDLPVIQNSIGANLNVGSVGSANTTLIYQGAIPLVFGFQAVRLDFDEGRYRAIKFVESGTVVAENVDRLDVDVMLSGDA